MQTIDNSTIIINALVSLLVIVVVWLLVKRYLKRRKKLIDLTKQQQTIDDKIKKAILQSEPTTKESTVDKDQ